MDKFVSFGISCPPALGYGKLRGQEKGKGRLEHRNENHKIHMFSPVTSLNFLCEKRFNLAYILLFFKEQ